jgi:hypothetical protein
MELVFMQHHLHVGAEFRSMEAKRVIALSWGIVKLKERANKESPRLWLKFNQLFEPHLEILEQGKLESPYRTSLTFVLTFTLQRE